MKRNPLTKKYHCRTKSLVGKCFESCDPSKIYIQIKECNEKATCLIVINSKFKIIERVELPYEEIANSYVLITNDYFDRIYKNVLSEIQK